MTDRLYILMRTDMESMNAGKAMAQAAHAANHFVHDMEKRIREEGPEISETSLAYTQWKSETPQGFGTTIVLDAGDESYMNFVVEMCAAEKFPAGVTNDPSYPVKDGITLHLLPVDTCAYVFVPSGERPVRQLNALKLHP